MSECRPINRKSDMKGAPRTENETNLEPDKHRRIVDHSSSTKWDVSSSKRLKFESLTRGQGETAAPLVRLLNSYGLMMVALRHPTLSMRRMKSAISSGKRH